jgi:hypothetical protein
MSEYSVEQIDEDAMTEFMASKVELPPVRGAGYEPLIAILSESLRETSAFGGAVCGVIIAI